MEPTLSPSDSQVVGEPFQVQPDQALQLLSSLCNVYVCVGGLVSSMCHLPMQKWGSLKQGPEEGGRQASVLQELLKTTEAGKSWEGHV